MSRVKIAEEILFLFSFSEFFFGFWAKNFWDFCPENFKKLSKLISSCPEEQFVTWISFKILNRFGFSAETFGMVLKILSKCPEENLRKKQFFLLFFSEFFLILSEIFSDFWPKNFKMFSKLPSTCPEEQFAAFFSKSFELFWIFYRNLYDGSQNSIYVSRVKFAEETVFFTFLFRILSDFERNFFRVLAKKLQEVVKTTFCVSRGTICDLIFFKVLNRSGFSAQTFGMALKSLSTCAE